MFSSSSEQAPAHAYSDEASLLRGTMEEVTRLKYAAIGGEGGTNQAKLLEMLTQCTGLKERANWHYMCGRPLHACAQYYSVSSVISDSDVVDAARRAAVIGQFSELYILCCLNEAQARLHRWHVTSSAHWRAKFDPKIFAANSYQIYIPRFWKQSS